MGHVSIELEAEIKAPLDRVWQAWTNPAELVKWLCEHANVQCKLGGAYELFWEPDHPEQNSTQGCWITEFEVNEKLGFTWKGPVPYASVMNVNPLPTSVLITLKGLDSGYTLIQLKHVGWGKDQPWAAAQKWQETAWQEALFNLQAYLNK